VCRAGCSGCGLPELPCVQVLCEWFRGSVQSSTQRRQQWAHCGVAPFHCMISLYLRPEINCSGRFACQNILVFSSGSRVVDHSLNGHTFLFENSTPTMHVSFTWLTSPRGFSVLLFLIQFHRSTSGLPPHRWTTHPQQTTQFPAQHVGHPKAPIAPGTQNRHLGAFGRQAKGPPSLSPPTQA
jgi:hypothetical protein